MDSQIEKKFKMFYVLYRIFNITASLPLKYEVEKQKDHQPQNEETTRY